MIKNIKENERWQFLIDFIDGYFERPIDENSGNTTNEIEEMEAKLEINLPLAVKEWFLLVGRRADITSAFDQNTLLTNLSLQNNFLSLYWESQMLWDCGIRALDLNLENPPAYFLSTDLDYVIDYSLPESSVVHEGVVQVSNSISTFLTNMVILQRLIGIGNDLNPTWKSNVICGSFANWKDSERISNEMSSSLFEVPWGHTVFYWKGTFLDRRTGNFITNDFESFNALKSRIEE